MIMTMMNLANHIIAVAQNNNLSITNLQLQKILYFTLIDGFRDNVIDTNWLQSEYDEPFLVWRYGPVVESVYEQFSIFGASEIFIPEIEIPKYTSLNNIILDLLEINVFELVRNSHKHLRWSSNEENINYGRSDIQYSLEDLMDAR